MESFSTILAMGIIIATKPPQNGGIPSSKNPHPSENIRGDVSSTKLLWAHGTVQGGTIHQSDYL
jgi:hypothetical protein